MGSLTTRAHMAQKVLDGGISQGGLLVCYDIGPCCLFAPFTCEIHPHLAHLRPFSSSEVPLDKPDEENAQAFPPQTFTSFPNMHDP